MRENRIKYLQTDDHFELWIRQNEATRIVVILLLTLTVISFLIPVAALFFLNFDGALILAILLFFSVGVYFLRLYLWNTQGREILKISKDQVTHVLDYALFQETTEIENKQVTILMHKMIDNEPVEEIESVLDDLSPVNEANLKITLINHKDDAIEVNEHLSIDIIKRLEQVLGISE